MATVAHASPMYRQFSLDLYVMPAKHFAGITRCRQFASLPATGDLDCPPPCARFLRCFIDADPEAREDLPQDWPEPPVRPVFQELETTSRLISHRMTAGKRSYAPARSDEMPQQQLKTECQKADKEPSAESRGADALADVLPNPHAEQCRDNGIERTGEIVDCERVFSCEADCQRHGRYRK